ncbi:MAG: tail fiber protein [Pyrinomonadaceae bacterium]
MAEPFLAEIRLMSFGFAPRGWALCNGQLLPINQNQALFALLGTTYGGNGQTNFALPDLRGRVPLHFGNSFTLGQAGGEEVHTLTTTEMPTHNHPMQGTFPDIASATTTGNNGFWGQVADNSTIYNTNPANAAMSAAAITNTGGSQPHENRQPFLTINLCIALQGIFPSQN